MTDANPPADVTGRTPAVGDRVRGMYRLDRRLGEGGMGTVFLATDVALHLPVALKFCRPEALALPTGRSRFQREARVMQSLRHSAMPRLLAVGEHRGLPFFAMTVAPGRRLSAWLHRPGFRLSVDRALRIMARLADLLAEFARVGIVHRDIKPDNIMVDCHGDDRETVTLIDFGLALGSPQLRLGSVAQPGRASGTPHYMSPETASGLEVDGRADVYSLGIVCHEMLLGRPPFRGTSTQALLNQHLFIRPRSVIESGGAVPVWVDELLFRMLAKTPAHRPPAAAVRDVLRMALSAGSRTAS